MTAIKTLTLLVALNLSYALVSIIGCTTTNISQMRSSDNDYETGSAEEIRAFAEDENFVVLITRSEDSLRSLAEEYLDDENKAWVIADFNDIDEILPNREIVIPLKPQNISGIFINGYQTIPILCYHRFDDTGHNNKLTVSEKSFRQQMQYLKDNNYRIIRMRDIEKFLSGEAQLPIKAVIITIDDGYRSTYDIAFPILKELKSPATLFLYTNFIGAHDAISWQQAKRMLASGLIDIQAHSKSHPNLSLMKNGESEVQYLHRISVEIDYSTQQIHQQLKIKPHIFAYPFGDTNQIVINHLKKEQYKLAVTVDPGASSSYAHPYLLRRTMIFGNYSLNDFIKTLRIFQKLNLR